MIKADELRAILYRKPFQPFRVRVSDGRTYDVRYPEMNLVGESVFIIGIPAPNDPNPRFYDTQAWIMLNMIDGIDLLPEAAPTSTP
jgi:hypothetical protein